MRRFVADDFDRFGKSQSKNFKSPTRDVEAFHSSTSLVQPCSGPSIFWSRAIFLTDAIRETHHSGHLCLMGGADLLVLLGLLVVVVR